MDIPLSGPSGHFSQDGAKYDLNAIYSSSANPEADIRDKKEEIPSESKSSWRRLQLARAKLKTSTKNSALLAGFAMVPMVELSIQDDEDDPIPLSILISFGIITTALVAVHLSAVMIASCILPYIDSIALSETESSDKESIQDSPHDKMHIFIEISWIFSNILGLILFLVEIILLTWVKFWQIGSGDGNEPGKKVAIASTITLIICIGFFIWFTIYFYRFLADHEYDRFKAKLNQVESGFERKRKLSVWTRNQIKRRKSSIKFSFGRKKSSIGITSAQVSKTGDSSAQMSESKVSNTQASETGDSSAHVERRGGDKVNYGFQEVEIV